jgi:tRNA A-37 threonylcarbamoyl transferase component Bud32
MDDNLPTQRASRDDGDTPTVRTPKKEVVFNRYELQGELGKGGMGVVWLALDRELNSKVALKFLREEMTSEADALKELKGEVIINRDLSHPNIIKTYSFETNERTSAISMEYVNGVNLHRLKKMAEPEARSLGLPAANSAGFFEVEDIKKWVWQLCDAMDYAHRQKVVHRDIKPANLMINERGELKVGDFGIGRTVADTVNRVTKNAAGTPPYMSPQQTMGERAVPGDDIYSIGATIYDLLTGDPPFFRGAIRDQTLMKVPPSMTERRKELSRNGKPIPPEWEKTVAACLAKDVADRPPTAQALREMLEGKFVLRPKATTQQTAKIGWVKWAGVAGAVVIAVAVVATILLMKRPHSSAGAGTSAGAAGQPEASKAAEPSRKSPVEELEESGKLTLAEGAAVTTAMHGRQGEYEKSLALRLAEEHSLTPEAWRNYSDLVPPGNETVSKLRPRLAAGIIKEKEFDWLLAAMAGGKGEEEKALAIKVIEQKALPLEEWRKQTELYPRPKDPFLEKVKPLIADGTVVQAEGQWLRDSLAGEKGDAEKALAEGLVNEKNVTPGQWRARTGFSYALKDDAVIDPANLPPAIDLALGGATSMRLLRIDPGAFVRGAPHEELGRRTNEQLPERVTIEKPFYIGVYEVTQAQFTGVMPRSPSYWRGNPTWPIDQVDWQTLAGSKGFLAKLNHALKAKWGGALAADLPSEDEWEYACRAGTGTSFYNGKGISNIDTDGALDPLANYNRSNGGSPRPVGSYQPNAWGLYDMLGNVSEWCQNRFLRGGSWQSKAANCRVTWRTQISSDASPSNQVGFRLVLRNHTATPGG